MEETDRRELAQAIDELYRVVEDLIKMLERENPRGVNTPIQQVANRLENAKKKTRDSLRRMATD